jgi:hypothetical protein
VFIYDSTKYFGRNCNEFIAYDRRAIFLKNCPNIAGENPKVNLDFFVPLAQSIFFEQNVSFSEEICEVCRDRISHQRRDCDDVIAFAVVSDEFPFRDVAVVNDVVVSETEAGVTNAFAELKT